MTIPLLTLSPSSLLILALVSFIILILIVSFDKRKERRLNMTTLPNKKTDERALTRQSTDTITKSLLSTLNSIQSQRYSEQAKFSDSDDTIKRQVLIALESTHIIETSDIPATVIGRCQLIADSYSRIAHIKELPNFQILFQETLDLYRNRYYDRIITEDQVYFFKIIDHLYLYTYITENLVQSMLNYLTHQQLGVSQLKTNAGRRKRIVKVLIYLDSLTSSIETLFDSSNPEIQEKLNEFKQSILKIIFDAKERNKDKVMINDLNTKL